jgi:leucyl aminopeptidase
MVLNPIKDFSIANVNCHNDISSSSIGKDDIVCILYNSFDSSENISKNYDFVKSQLDASILEQIENIRQNEEFSKFGSIISFFPKNFSKLVLVNLNKKDASDEDASIDSTALKLLGYFKKSAKVHFFFKNDCKNDLDNESFARARNFLQNLILNTYAFNKYKNFSTNKEFHIYSYTSDDLDLNFINSTCVLKTYANYGPNDLYPMSYAESIKNLLEPLGVKVTIVDSAKLQELGMDAIYSVGKGSIQKPCAVFMEWNNDGETEKLGFVGKGVTFDTGGISIKPSGKMDEMKFDMCGSAVSVGLMHLVASSKLKLNVVCAVGLAENMPSGEAMRPGDVISSMSGQTIEVLNTDAEGRLVLADVLWYIQEKCGVKKIIDLATLTGAIVVSLGSEYAGLFSNNDEMANQIYESSIESNEKVWRFPLTKEYDKMIDSKVAHMKNISTGSGAGSITAAQFLQRFIQKETKWAHIDIAGVSYKNGFSTGFGLKLLYNWINKITSK